MVKGGIIRKEEAYINTYNDLLINEKAMRGLT